MRDDPIFEDFGIWALYCLPMMYIVGYSTRYTQAVPLSEDLQFVAMVPMVAIMYWAWHADARWMPLLAGAFLHGGLLVAAGIKDARAFIECDWWAVVAVLGEAVLILASLELCYLELSPVSDRERRRRPARGA